MNTKWRLVPVVAIMLATAVMAPGAAAADLVSALAGSWGGSGRITYADGSSEGIQCTANYTGGGNELRLAIQCKSDKNPIHVRSKLRIDGSRASGEWEERTFNASGSASGSVGANGMSLSISGGGFDGSMSVTVGKSSHSIVISAKGVAMSRVAMNFSRR